MNDFALDAPITLNLIHTHTLSFLSRFKHYIPPYCTCTAPTPRCTIYAQAMSADFFYSSSNSFINIISFATLHARFRPSHPTPLIFHHQEDAPVVRHIGKSRTRSSYIRFAVARRVRARCPFHNQMPISYIYMYFLLARAHAVLRCLNWCFMIVYIILIWPLIALATKPRDGRR